MSRHTPPPQDTHRKSVASIIRDAIDRGGYKDVKDCARQIEVPYDLLNKVVGGHIPKDSQLAEYARKLDIDHRELLLAAYREKAPADMRHYFNSVRLLERHHPNVEALMDIIDASRPAQIEELLHVARLIRESHPAYARKALALINLYHQLPEKLQSHFDATVQLCIRENDCKARKQFVQSVLIYNSAPGRQRRGVRSQAG